MSQPFDPLLLDMMMDALCSYQFSDLGVGDHVSSDLFDSFLISRVVCNFTLQRLGHSPGLALVCESW